MAMNPGLRCLAALVAATTTGPAGAAPLSCDQTPLYEFWNGTDHFTCASYEEATSAGWVLRGLAFRVYRTEVATGLRAIHRCRAYATGDHFVSIDGSCEGQANEGRYGYLAVDALDGHVPVHRFFKPSTGDHLATTDWDYAVSAGYTHESVLGYAPHPYGTDLVLRGSFAGREVVISAPPTGFAGAISSMTWNGQQFVDLFDHGRELQSAATFDGFGECYNPTEAGSRNDGRGSISSVLLCGSTASGALETRNLMAFWLAPGQERGSACSSTHPKLTTAQNTSTTSRHALEKTVRLGYEGIENVIDYQVTFDVPERRSSAVFEAVTGYMPPTFSRFLSYDPKSMVLRRLSDGPGEQSLPVILATAAGGHAMGVMSPSLPQRDWPHRGYGRWRFDDTVKWNCVYRHGAIVPGRYSFHCLVPFGSVDHVTDALTRLHARFNPSHSSGDIDALYRFWNGREHLITAHYTEGASAGYQFELTAFKVHTTAVQPGMLPLHRCRIGSNHFVSTSTTCEGQVHEGRYGYVFTSAAADRIPVYRFFHAGLQDHLATTNYSEAIHAGYTYESLLGYAPTGP